MTQTLHISKGCEFDGQLYPEGAELTAHCVTLECRDSCWHPLPAIADCCECAEVCPARRPFPDPSVPSRTLEHHNCSELNILHLTVT